MGECCKNTQSACKSRHCFALEELAPLFTAPALYNNQEVTINLTDYRTQWLLLFFYSSDFTFVWPQELAAVAAFYPYIRQLNADTVAISTDSVYAHKVFQEISPSASRVQYPLLSDRTGKIAQAYGVLDEKKGAAYRASFIIDPLGRIRYYSVYPREVGRNVEEIIRVLAGIQYGELTGEGVPPGWVPGAPGIPRDFNTVGRY